MNKKEQLDYLKDKLLKQQDYICPICKVDMLKMESKNRCLDHNHDTGYVRAVVCRNCNSMEGKIAGCIRRAKRQLSADQWWHNLVHFWAWHHHTNPDACKEIHPYHKTPDEKRELRNKRAKRNRLNKRKSGPS